MADPIRKKDGNQRSSPDTDRPGWHGWDFKGEVIGVLDGDTIEVLHNKKAERIRLYGIDCPEKWQSFGQKGKQATSSLLFGKDVRIETHGRDKHRRTLGTVFRGDVNVNQVLVKEGYALTRIRLPLGYTGA